MPGSLLRKNTDNAALVSRGDDHPQFVMSDESVDRYSDIVRAGGWRLNKFNGVALANHDNTFPLGQWKDVHVEGTRLLGRFKAAPQGVSNRVDEVLKMIEFGILNSCSVGFLPISQKPRPGGGIEYTAQELVECSIVSVPANANACIIAAKAIGVSDSLITRVFSNPPKNGSLAQRAAHARGMLSVKPKTQSNAVDIALKNARDAMAKKRRAQHSATRAEEDRDHQRALEILACGDDEGLIHAVLTKHHQQDEARRDRINRTRTARRAEEAGAEFAKRIKQGADPEALMKSFLNKIR